MAKKNGKGRGNGKKGDKWALEGIVQGVGRAVEEAIGSKKKRRAKRKRSSVVSLRCFDAFHSDHLSLPRAVGEYTVVRYTQNIQATDRVMVFGTFRDNLNNTLGNHTWSTLCSVGTPNTAYPMNSATPGQECIFRGMESWGDAANNYARFVPSAVSVQIMNPEALQTSQGITYIGRMKTMPGMMNNNQTWGEFANNFVSFNAPRLCSAAKLAMRGVQVDAVPMNMSELSDFSPRSICPAFKQVVWNGNSAPDFEGSSACSGFSPIVVYNPGGINLQYLVCIEMRVRFDPQNPAMAGHVHHPIASDSTWDRVMRAMSSMGHGAVDIVERVANNGEAVLALARGANALMG